jgi:hypothetical protein
VVPALIKRRTDLDLRLACSEEVSDLNGQIVSLTKDLQECRELAIKASAGLEEASLMARAAMEFMATICEAIREGGVSEDVWN